MEKKQKKNVHSILLLLCDLAWVCIAALFVFLVNPSKSEFYSFGDILGHVLLAAPILFCSRYLWGVYSYVWRYGRSMLNVKLMVADTIAGVVYYIVQRIVPIESTRFIRALCFFALILLGSLGMRQYYQYLYEVSSRHSKTASFTRKLTYHVFGIKIDPNKNMDKARKINIAIVGAGRIGVNLMEDLIQNPSSAYEPVLFIDNDRVKTGRSINGIPILHESEIDNEVLAHYEVQEIVLAIRNLDAKERKELFDFYKQTGRKLMTYDYPLATATDSNGKLQLREFDVGDLLFRQQKSVMSTKAKEYYRDKIVLITGGGGSIGSELCRQVAKRHPKQLIILDICENGAYDVQQELKVKYRSEVDVRIEIVSVCNRIGLERVFTEYHPDIVIHAAAHKHVPLMEKNCIEAVENNVFGTLNVVQLSEKYGVERMMMVSTDKAVNPTNVMGATKRMCEMIVQSHAAADETVRGKTTFSITRFGNVLGSAGSVIPLFKRQIAAGGPITLTDDRITRFFMTIPEASSLVLEAGAMARNGELFVLDMGEPVRIRDLAENMIRLSGLSVGTDIEIVTTGLRPGEKLYEELLVKTEEMDRTENEMIFIERDAPRTLDEIAGKLDTLKAATKSDSDQAVKDALKTVVPTYKEPVEM